MTTIRHSVETLVVMAVLLAGWPVSAAGQAVAVSSNNDPVMTLSISDLSPAEKEVIAADASWAQAHQSCDMELMDQVLHDDPMFIHARPSRYQAACHEAVWEVLQRGDDHFAIARRRDQPGYGCR